jgi:hypothetical protein
MAETFEDREHAAGEAAVEAFGIGGRAANWTRRMG